MYCIPIIPVCLVILEVKRLDEGGGVWVTSYSGREAKKEGKIDKSE
jgi:hypothetical protein